MTPREALTRCEALCARSEQSSGDIAIKLRKWGIGKYDSDAILGHLIEGGFVNDARYACAYVRNKFHFAGWGRVKIAYSLQQKGIDNAIISIALSEIEDDEYNAKAEYVLRNKYNDVKTRALIQARGALLRFAEQRGFESSVAMPIVNKILSGRDSDDTDCDF